MTESFSGDRAAPALGAVSDERLSAFLHAALFGRTVLETLGGERFVTRVPPTPILPTRHPVLPSLVTPPGALDVINTARCDHAVQRAERPGWHPEDWGSDAVGRWHGAVRSDHGDRVEIEPGGEARFTEWPRFVCELYALAFYPTSPASARALLDTPTDA
jgi:hypothetical protein